MSTLGKKTEFEIVVKSSQEGTGLADAKREMEEVKDAADESSKAQVDAADAVSDATKKTASAQKEVVTAADSAADAIDGVTTAAQEATTATEAVIDPVEKTTEAVVDLRTEEEKAAEKATAIRNQWSRTSAKVAADSKAASQNIGGMSKAMNFFGGVTNVVTTSLGKVFAVMGLINQSVELINKLKDWLGFKEQAEEDAAALEEAADAADRYAEAVENLQSIKARDKLVAETLEKEQMLATAIALQKRLTQERLTLQQQSIIVEAQRAGNAVAVAQSELDLALLAGKIDQETYDRERAALDFRVTEQQRELEFAQKRQAVAAAQAKIEDEIYTPRRAAREELELTSTALGGIGSLDAYKAYQETVSNQASEGAKLTARGVNWMNLRDDLREPYEMLYQLEEGLKALGMSFEDEQEKEAVIADLFARREKAQAQILQINQKEIQLAGERVKAEQDLRATEEVNERSRARDARLYSNTLEGQTVKAQQRVGAAVGQIANAPFDFEGVLAAREAAREGLKQLEVAEAASGAAASSAAFYESQVKSWDDLRASQEGANAATLQGVRAITESNRALSRELRAIQTSTNFR